MYVAPGFSPAGFSPAIGKGRTGVIVLEHVRIGRIAGRIDPDEVHFQQIVGSRNQTDGSSAEATTPSANRALP
jgi:hypothetical protein